MIRRRELLGTVGVDSGQLMIVDPCYIDSEWKASDPYDSLEDAATSGYAEACKATDSNMQGGPCLGVSRKRADQTGYNDRKLDFPLALAFRSGFGDGVYEVYAEYASNEETGGWGERVARVEIVLIEDEEKNVEGHILDRLAERGSE